MIERVLRELFTEGEREMPSLSIIVPTKNRYKFIKAIIKKFLDDFGTNAELELVIQDNSDDNSEIQKFLETNNSFNVVYNYDRGNLSVCENFTNGILKSSGEYICMIGDDDGFTDEIIRVVEYMQQNQIESAIFNKAHYKWPDALNAMSKRRFFELKTHSLAIHRCDGRISSVNPSKELDLATAEGFFQLRKMPEIYHGIVKRSCMDVIYKATGTYFPGASPDMANAVALSLIVKKHVYINSPVVFSGQNAVSTGGQGLRKQHVGKISDQHHLPVGTEERWSDKLPKIWTAQTIYAQSAVEVLTALHKEDMLQKINWEYLYAKFAVDHKDYKEMVDSLMLNSESRNRYAKYKRKIEIHLAGRYPMYWVRKILGRSLDYYYDNVEDTIEAAECIEKFIEKCPIVYA